MINKALKWSLIIVLLLSVLFPVGAYFGIAAVFILAIKARRTRQMFAVLAADPAALVMLLCVLLSVIYSKDILMSIGGVVMLCINLCFYLVLMVELKSIEIQKYYKLLNLACLIACIYGIYQYISGNLIINKSWVDAQTFGNIIRVYSTLLNPNIFAGFLAINLSFSIARFKKPKEEILLSLNIILSSVCLLLTYSRGGFAAFGSAMLVLCLLKERKRSVALYLAAMTAAFFIVNSTGPVSRADIGTVYRDSSSLYRLEIWKSALNMFLESPVFGNGIGTTWYYLSSGSEKLYRYILHSHNIYLQVAAEMGIVGLCGFIFFVVEKLKTGFMLLKAKSASEDTSVVQGFIACASGILVHGLIDAVIFVPALSFVFMGYFALYSRTAAKYQTEVLSIHGIHGVQKLRRLSLLDSKGSFKLFFGKSTCKNERQEEEGKAY